MTQSPKLCELPPIGWRFIVALCGIIFLLHFTFTYIAGFPFTVGFVGLVWLVAFHTKFWRALPAVVIAWFALALFAGLQFVCLGLTGSDLSEFAKTFLLVLFNIAIWVIALRAPTLIDQRTLRLVAFIALATVCGFCLLQYLSYRIAGTTALYGILGRFSYFNVVHPPVTQGLVRAYAGYLEPSFCALVILAMTTVLLVLRFRVWQTLAIAAVGIYCTGSFSGIVALLLLIASSLLITSFRGFAYGLLGAAVICVVAVVLSGGEAVGYVARRIDEALVPGSSTYFRLVGPLDMVWDTLRSYPLGRGLGMVENVIFAYNIAHAGQVGNSLDNGWYLVVFYFGWFGIIFLLLLLYFWCGALLRRNARVLLAISFFLLSANFTGGGIFNAEYALLSLLVICSARQVVVADANLATLRSCSIMQRQGGENMRIAQRRQKSVCASAGLRDMRGGLGPKNAN